MADVLEPYSNPYLIGHENAERVFLNAWKKGGLHSSWLIGGPEGIGKATFAYRAARFLLSADENHRENYQSLDVSPNDTAFRLIARRAHPNLKILERDFIETDRKKVLKAIKDGTPMEEKDLQNLKKSAVIRIDEIRAVIEFLSKKSFDGQWRIVIIDSVDDMNTASCNAILKILEEPPAKSLIFLISHNPYRLLPTIRSRCSKLNLMPLEENKLASLIRRYAPELSETEVKGLSGISSGSIGRALRYVRCQALKTYQRLESACYRFDVDLAMELAEETARDEEKWDLICELMTHFVSDNLKGGQNVKKLGVAWDNCLKMQRDTIALNMDKKLNVLLMIHEIGKALSC